MMETQIWPLVLGTKTSIWWLNPLNTLVYVCDIHIQSVMKINLKIWIYLCGKLMMFLFFFLGEWHSKYTQAGGEITGEI